MAEESTPNETQEAEEAEVVAEAEEAEIAADTETVLGDAEQAIDDARQRLAEVPAEIVVTNHVMGLYELAAIHLSSTPPNLTGASLAIDSVGCLVDGLGDRLGPDAPTLRDALANIRIAFVSVKSAVAKETGESSDRGGDDSIPTDDDALGAQ